MPTRRQFLHGAGVAILGASLVSRAQAESLPEAPSQTKPLTQPPPMPGTGPSYNPVVTLNGWSLIIDAAGGGAGGATSLSAGGGERPGGAPAPSGRGTVHATSLASGELPGASAGQTCAAPDCSASTGSRTAYSRSRWRAMSSPYSATIHSSGHKRSAQRSFSSFLASVVFPEPGRPHIR